MQGAPELVLSALVPKRYDTAEIGWTLKTAFNHT